MRHPQVKSNLVDASPEASKLEFEGSSRPFCPKPRRPGPAIPDQFLIPLTCSKHSQPTADGKSGVLNMIPNKRMEASENNNICSGCWPCCYSGSPPGRTPNPLVHDVEFLHQMDQLPSPFPRTKLSIG